MKKPYQPRGGNYKRTNINITPERKRKAVRIGGSISGGIAKALDMYPETIVETGWIDLTEYGYSKTFERNAPESEKE